MDFDAANSVLDELRYTGTRARVSFYTSWRDNCIHEVSSLDPLTAFPGSSWLQRPTREREFGRKRGSGARANDPPRWRSSPAKGVLSSVGRRTPPNKVPPL